jgi:hypothetical protein
MNSNLQIRELDRDDQPHVTTPSHNENREKPRSFMSPSCRHVNMATLMSIAHVCTIAIHACALLHSVLDIYQLIVNIDLRGIRLDTPHWIFEHSEIKLDRDTAWELLSNQ